MEELMARIEKYARAEEDTPGTKDIQIREEKWFAEAKPR